MFNCPVHNWSSFVKPCPVCFPETYVTTGEPFILTINKEYYTDNQPEEIKLWDWTIEVNDNGFIFISMECIREFGGGRYTFSETKKAYEYFNKIDNPDIPRTQEEGRELIAKIKEHISNGAS